VRIKQHLYCKSRFSELGHLASMFRQVRPQAANPFARALLAAVDPNARKKARKCLERRQAVDTTSKASSGKPGRKTAGGLTKAKSFGHESSGGRT
jgi:prophage antirepressor-like protein